VLVLDRSRPLDSNDRSLLAATATNRVVVANKSDLPEAWTAGALDCGVIPLSARTGAGLDTLLERMAAQLGGGDGRRDPPLVSNVRHIALLERARLSLDRASYAFDASNGGVSEEFVLADLQEAAAALQEITGRRTADDLLAHIFARFCIGK
jgi:tRNA modification GTPase